MKKMLYMNLNHRINEKPIHPTFLDLSSAYDPDVIAAVEYVDGPSRESFKRTLCAAGYPFCKVSEPLFRHNQALAASKDPNAMLAPFPRDPNFPQLESNCRSFISHGIGIYVLRIPCKRMGEARACHLEMIARHKPFIVIGDFNEDPARDPIPFKNLEQLGMKHLEIRGPSFWPHPPKLPSTIDHVFVRDLPGARARYITELNGVPFAGPGRHFMTDHAAILLEWD